MQALGEWVWGYCGWYLDPARAVRFHSSKRGEPKLRVKFERVAAFTAPHAVFPSAKVVHSENQP